MTAGQLALLLATVSPDAPVVLEVTDVEGNPLETDPLQAEGVWGNRVTLSAVVTA